MQSPFRKGFKLWRMPLKRYAALSLMPWNMCAIASLTEGRLCAQAAELAKDFTNKLFTNGASEARSSVMKLAGDVSSWWATLDPVPKQPQEPSPQATSRSTHVRVFFNFLSGLHATRAMTNLPCA